MDAKIKLTCPACGRVMQASFQRPWREEHFRWASRTCRGCGEKISVRVPREGEAKQCEQGDWS